jgi:hypothetical protein
MAALSNYIVFIYTGTTGTPNLPPGGCRASITLMDTSNPPKGVGYLRFWDLGVAIPADTIQSGIPVGNMPWAAFSAVIDLLRNEKPLVFDGATVPGSVFSQLKTGQGEPVGEGGA